ncbi:MAG: CehA/McbA family metallohydrolase [Planctomycetia bacterium]
MHALLLALLVQEPIQLLDTAVPQARLAFDIRDPDGQPLPARLTFRGAGGVGANLFTRVDAAPDELAVRRNVVYSLSGSGLITVPAGSFQVFATHGLEWSLAEQRFEFEPGKDYRFEAVLRQEIDSTGWISGDFHLHTLTHSGHGDSNLKERVISLVGEGVEFAVATDHNHNTTYEPEVETLKLSSKLAHITGNEVTTPIGHLNAFPLDPKRPPVRADLRDSTELFRIIRSEPNEFGVVPIIQLNHPRYVAIDWFGETGLDPISGTSSQANWSAAFDALEIFNANASWGYFDAETVQNQGTGVHSALTDWFHLLNRGHRHAGVGNSDSHTVHYEFAGFPRNFLQLGVDRVPDIRTPDVIQAIRAKRLFTTSGPFVDFSVDGAPLGSQVSAQGAQVSIRIRVQAAGWCDVDRVKLVVNGDVVAQWSVPQERKPLRFERETGLDVAKDAWVLVLVEGDDTIDPLVEESKDRCLPLAVTNPVWIDADGDGRMTSLAERVRADLAQPALLPPLLSRGSFEQGLVCLTAVERAHPQAAAIVAQGLRSPEREVMLCAGRAAEKLGQQAPIDALEDAWSRAQKMDGFAQLTLVRAMAAKGMPQWQTRLPQAVAAMLDRSHLHAREISTAFAWRWIEDWEVSEPRALESSSLGKFRLEQEGLVWKALPPEAVKKGRITLSGTPEQRETRVRCWIDSPDKREVFLALGADDDACLWINGVEAARRTGSGRTDPPQLFVRANLIQGANRVELLVQNRKGAHGMRLGVLDSGLTIRR